MALTCYRARQRGSARSYELPLGALGVPRQRRANPSGSGGPHRAARNFPRPVSVGLGEGAHVGPELSIRSQR